MARGDPLFRWGGSRTAAHGEGHAPARKRRLIVREVREMDDRDLRWRRSSLTRRGFLGGIAATAASAILAACGGSSATDTPKPSGATSAPATSAATAAATARPTTAAG